MKSKTIQIYKKWLEQADPKVIEFVDSVYHECEQNYEAGGDTIVECFEPNEIVEEFKTLNEMRKYCGLKVEQALNSRWGEDSDPEVARYKKFKKWNKGTL